MFIWKNLYEDHEKRMIKRSIILITDVTLYDIKSSFQYFLYVREANKNM